MSNEQNAHSTASWGFPGRPEEESRGTAARTWTRREIHRVCFLLLRLQLEIYHTLESLRM